MQTRFLTSVKTSFNPFRPKSKPLRLFLSLLPADARSNIAVKTSVLPRHSPEIGSLHLTFKDGKEMHLDAEKLGIKGIMEEVERHSRMLARQQELSG